MNAQTIQDKCKQWFCTVHKIFTLGHGFLNSFVSAHLKNKTALSLTLPFSLVAGQIWSWTDSPVGKHSPGHVN